MLRRTDAHRYFYGEPQHERELVGVTRTLIENHFVDDRHFSERVRTRGKLSHQLIECALKGQELPPWFEPYQSYVIGMRRCIDRERIEVRGVEEMVCDLARGYAGTIDFWGVYLSVEAEFDVKLSQPEAWHGLQLAAYAYAKWKKDWFRIPRFGVYLTSDGSYRLKQYSDLDDLDVFFRALANLQWRIRKGSYERAYGKSIDFGDRDGEDRRSLRTGNGDPEDYSHVVGSERHDRDDGAEGAASDADRRLYPEDV